MPTVIAMPTISQRPPYSTSRLAASLSVTGVPSAGQPGGASAVAIANGAAHRGQSAAPAAVNPRYALHDGQTMLLNVMLREKTNCQDR